MKLAGCSRCDPWGAHIFGAERNTTVVRDPAELLMPWMCRPWCEQFYSACADATMNFAAGQSPWGGMCCFLYVLFFLDMFLPASFQPIRFVTRTRLRTVFAPNSALCLMIPAATCTSFVSCSSRFHCFNELCNPIDTYLSEVKFTRQPTRSARPPALRRLALSIFLMSCARVPLWFTFPTRFCFCFYFLLRTWCLTFASKALSGRH